MKQNQNLSATGAQSMTSLEIAQVTGKMHKDVMKAIRNMEPAWEQERGRKFALMQIREEIPNGGYRLRPVFVLSKTECLYVATKFNDVARAKLVLRWEELEPDPMERPLATQDKRLEKKTLEMLERGDAFGDVVLDLLELFVRDWKDYGSAAIGLAKAVAALKQEARNECIPVDKLFQSQLEHFEREFLNID
jgi:phage regulator Rha-like protein